jgi:hypothetical protein
MEGTTAVLVKDVECDAVGEIRVGLVAGIF